jgi:folylpolyglutamate synthase/dihydropteroate synthase
MTVTTNDIQDTLNQLEQDLDEIQTSKTPWERLESSKKLKKNIESVKQPQAPAPSS